MCSRICSFVIGAMEQIAHDELARVVKSVTTCSSNMIAAFYVLLPNMTRCFRFLPPVLPTQLVKLRGLEFAEVTKGPIVYAL
jgi:hypothetical protein